MLPRHKGTFLATLKIIYSQTCLHDCRLKWQFCCRWFHLLGFAGKCLFELSRHHQNSHHTTENKLGLPVNEPLITDLHPRSFITHGRKTQLVYEPTDAKEGTAASSSSSKTNSFKNPSKNALFSIYLSNSLVAVNWVFSGQKWAFAEKNEWSPKK